MRRTYRYLTMLIFVISSFLFINKVNAETEVTVLNPTGASCNLYEGSAGKCFYKDKNLNSYVKGVIWLDTGDKVKILDGYDKLPSNDTNLCSDYYVYVSYYFPKKQQTFYGYYCNANLINHESALTEELKTEFEQAKFPKSYWADLAIMKKAHPTWKFVALETNLDWEQVISAESNVGINLIEGNEEGYRSTLGGSYDYYTDVFNVFEGSSWYAVNKPTVAYYMDPRNFLSDMYVFQFESLVSNPEIQTIDGVKTVLGENYLSNYSIDFITAAEKSGVSSIYLAALAFQEVGGGSVATSGEGFTYNPLNTKYASLRGTWIDGGFYNVYNIGAGTDKSPAQNSVVYAMGGADKSDTSFERPWDTMTKAIEGGALFIGEKFITKGQYNIYLKKFNVISTYWDIYSHQYQSNIKAAADEGNNVYRSYNSLNLLDSDFVFSIPVYKNMPETVSELPAKGNPNNYLKTLKINNTDVEGFDGGKADYKVHVSYDVKVADIDAIAVNSNASIENTGEKDLVVGDNVFELVVTAQNGDKKTYNLNIVRSKNTSGEPTVDEIVNNSGVKSDGTYFSGFEIDTNTQTLVEKIKSLNPEAIVKITDSNDNEKVNVSFATGDKISITSAGEEKSYTVVIYGDTSGNGKIDPLDLLKVQKHILDVNGLSGAYLKAGDANKDGKINPLDLLIIQKHILEVSYIKQ